VFCRTPFYYNLQQMIVFFVACADASVPTENVVSTTFAVLRFEIGTKNRRVSNCAAMTLFLK